MARNNRKRDEAHRPTYQGMHISGKKWQSAWLNSEAEWFYYNWLLQLAISRFKWSGLPSEIDERFLELALCEWGLAVFWWNDDYDKYFALQASPSGNINAYRNPTAFTTYGYGDSPLNVRLRASECVPIWNNLIRSPECFAIQHFARKLASIDRTFDTHLSTQKAPIIIVCEESQRLTVDNMVKQWQGNEPIVFGDGQSLAGINIEYLTPNPKMDYNGTKLLNDQAQVWAQAMNFLGISNSDIRKAERVQSAEVDANNEQTESSGLITLDARRQACELINERYGLAVWCDRNTDYSSRNFAALMSLPAINAGVVDDGEL